jgi:hypothetical protein
MSLASVKEIAAIHEIVDPWLRIRSYSAARDVGGLYPEGPYAFEADVKADPEAPLDAEWGTAQAARNIRAHLANRAADALDALEAAGWHPAGRVQIEIGGGVILVPDGPSVYGPVGAEVRFTVDRHRTEAERAMDPDVIADRLLGPLV